MTKVYRTIYIEQEMLDRFDRLAAKKYQSRNQRLEMLIAADLDQSAEEAESLLSPAPEAA